MIPNKTDRIKRESEQEKEIKEKVVAISRVAKVVKGGRTFRFSTLVVVGDGKGRVGCGIGKAAEIPDAVRKGIEDAKKNMISVPLRGTTVHHEVIGTFGAGKVLIKPASEGTGIIAGGPVRAVMELLGVKDIRTKSLRSNNPKNMIKAALEGLKIMKDPEQFAKLRGMSVKDLYAVRRA